LSENNSLASKFAILSSLSGSQHLLPAEAFATLAPFDMLALFQAGLGDEKRDMIQFGFSDDALLAVLSGEFDLDLDRKALLFVKTSLDTTSIRLAGGGYASDACAVSHAENRQIAELAQWLFNASRSLYLSGHYRVKSAEALADYTETLKQYLYKQHVTSTETLWEQLATLSNSTQAIIRFCNTMTADAMFKYDAASLLFGSQTAYPQAWFKKYIFRHQLAKSVSAFINQAQEQTMAVTY
jgi:hypothetical protein